MLAEMHDLFVITAEFHRKDIEAARAKSPRVCRNVKFVYVSHRAWHYAPTAGWRFVEQTCLKPIMNCAYSLWMRDAYRLARKLHHDVRFDLVHLLTYVGFRFPGQYWRLNTPFVWGPIGGLENTSWRFLPTLGMSGCFYYAGRNLINSLQKRLLPGPKRAFKKAHGGIIAATEGIRTEIRRCYGEQSEVICEIGPPSAIAETCSTREPGEPLRLIWSGLHLPGKALPLLLNALERLPNRLEWELTVLGHGRCTQKWQRLSRRLGIDDKCCWPGWIPREQACRLMSESHICVITSMKDLTSTVLLEALAQGVPVICPDHCGFTDAVTEHCGIKLPVANPSELQAHLAAAIKKLADNEEQRRRLAAGALRRIEDFAWQRKAEMVDRIYRRAVEGLPSGEPLPQPVVRQM